MANPIKHQQHILEKLKIEQLNAMQEEAQLVISSGSDVILISPTGTGKTLAFLLPIIEKLDVNCSEVQVLILVPSRELAIQIEQVIREMGTGYKVNCLYGGRSTSKDKIDLKQPPAILIGTPGRIADHLWKESFSIENLNILVLDEFDKSLEVGFEEEMSEIIIGLPNIKQRILTSATHEIQIPKFVGLEEPKVIDYSKTGTSQLDIKTVVSPSKDKFDTLLNLLHGIGNHPGIIFCNFKDSIQQVSDFLKHNGIDHGCFHGGMEQKDRERALIKFRNGTYQIIIATDLAARGIDIPEIKYIIHYQLPIKSQEFTHRNGRTARMNSKGTAYVIQWEKEILPDFIKIDNLDNKELQNKATIITSNWKTLFISGGRKDKISKGDVAGLFFKQGNLNKNELGIIELKQDCTFVAVPSSKASQLIKSLNNSKLKKKKVRITII